MRAAFERRARILKYRIERLVELPVEEMDPATARARLRAIGES